MKAIVNKDSCIGCGACNSIAPGIFEMDDDGLAISNIDEIPEDRKNEVIDASESCPTSAIEIDQ